MSQVRENSKCGFGDGETHVRVPSEGTTTATTTAAVPVESSVSDQLGHHQRQEMEVSIRIPNNNDEGLHHLDENENENDSDPPVENYDMFQGEFLNDDDEEDDDSNNNTSPGHDWIAAAAEHKQLIQRRRAQGHYHRKRKKSTNNVDTNYVPPYKKRFRRHASVLPSKFLLGGNIRDPLNLASLADDKVNAALNAETPKSSPVPIPMYRHGEVPVFIPKNPDDPLGLQCEAENPYDFIAGVRRNKIRKHRNRKKGGRKRTDSECSVDKSEDSDGKEKDTSVSSEEDLKSGLVVHAKEENVENEKEKTETQEGKKVPEAQPPQEPPPPKEDKGSVIIALPAPPKKKSRTRRKSKKWPEAPGPEVNLLLGKSSVYVPLGTPSVHEPTQFYEEYSEPGNSNQYQAFESPLVNYCSSCNEGVEMEPFSPPPKPEIKRRRIEVPAPEAAENQAPATPEKVKIPQKQTPAVKTPLKAVDTKVTPESSKNLDNFVKPAPLARSLSTKPNRKRFRHKADPIVSPVIPQPGCHRRFNHHNHLHHYHHHHHHNHHGRHQNVKKGEEPSDEEAAKNESGGQSIQEPGTVEQTPKFRKKDAVFQYGNYNRYYGYRTIDGDDLRLKAFPRGFFEAKDILDVGCNIGHVTLLIARDYGANFVQGIDIDPKLIEVAKKNVKHYVDRDPSDETIRFPHSCPLMYGVLQPPPSTVGDKRKIPFPYNISFKHENYVLETDELLEGVKPEYDVILCLSITKWIHLNYGDDGLKRFFRRAFLHLRPGGKLVVEPQPWSSYKRKKKLSETIFENFKKIRFYPDKFSDYLTKGVGFTSVERLTTPTHHAKGFHRPLLVFTKPASKPEKSNSVADHQTVEASVTTPPASSSLPMDIKDPKPSAAEVSAK